MCNKRNWTNPNWVFLSRDYGVNKLYHRIPFLFGYRVKLRVAVVQIKKKNTQSHTIQIYKWKLAKYSLENFIKVRLNHLWQFAAIILPH